MSWAPVDLAPIVAGIQAGEIVGPTPSILQRTDGIALLYPGEVHSLSGEPESGKGWTALKGGEEVLAAGGHVLYLDFEDAPASVIGRLLAIGTNPTVIVERFAYVRPTEPLGPDDLSNLRARHDWALAIIDGLSEAYTLLGLDPYSNVDAARFLAILPRPLADQGAAVLQIDHVVKAKDQRGRYALGAQHKLAGIAAAYTADVIKAPSRSSEGLMKLRVEKDRHGHVRGHSTAGEIALVRITPQDDGATVTVTIEPPETTISETGEWRPTHLMGKISAYVTDNPGATKNAIRGAITGRAGYVDKALAALISDGYLERRKDGQSYAHHTVKAFIDEPSPTESQPSPGHSTSDRVPGSHPLRDPAPDPVPSKASAGDRVPLDWTPERAEQLFSRNGGAP